MKRQIMRSTVQRTQNTEDLSAGMTFFFSCAGALILANIYYAQPILADMAADIGLAPAASGGILTLLQILHRNMNKILGYFMHFLINLGSDELIELSCPVHIFINAHSTDLNNLKGQRFSVSLLYSFTLVPF